MSQWQRNRVTLDVSAGNRTAPQLFPCQTPDPAPFKILAIADLSGRENRRLRSGLAGRRLIPLDCDNFDRAIEALEPRLELPLAKLRFQSLDDFHPDSIYRRAPLFHRLRELRERPPGQPRRIDAPAASAPAPPGADLLDCILAQAESESAPPQPQQALGDLSSFVKRLAAPYSEPRPDPDRQAWAASVNSASVHAMRRVLHHPAFQNLEAVWRSLRMLVDRLEPDSALRVFILDATLEDLSAEPESFLALAAGETPWSLIVADYSFIQDSRDADRLHCLGQMALALETPLIAEAAPQDAAPDPLWDELRGSPEARWLGLALSRFLLRLPYGKETSPVEEFEFEEMRGSVHEEYLWGNPAFCCALQIGRQFRSAAHGPGAARDTCIEGPVHVFANESGDLVARPCAEVYWSDDDASSLLDRGFMPLTPVKPGHAAIIPRIQSIAAPPVPLAGRWSRYA